jgi:peptide/nickel transport system permease protein
MFKVVRDLFRHDGRFAFGFCMILGIVLLALLYSFCPYDLSIWNTVPRDRPPSIKYLLGTNSQGQDVFWYATAAIRNSLIIGIVAALLSRVIAVLVALIAGYRGGLTDRVLMSINDSFVVLPLLPVLVLVASMLRGRMGLIGLGVVLAVFGWAWDARLIRAQILSLREREFTKTAILSGMTSLRLVLGEHLPFVIPLIMATAINNISFVIGTEIVLAVFGLSSLETPTLGVMIYWSVNYQAMLLGIWWWLLTPVVICILLILSLYLLSVSISDFLDPRTRLQVIKVRG